MLSKRECRARGEPLKSVLGHRSLIADVSTARSRSAETQAAPSAPGVPEPEATAAQSTHSAREAPPGGGCIRSGRAGAARRGRALSRLHGACGLLGPGGRPAPLPTGPAKPSRGGAGTCAGAGLKALGPDRSVVPANFRPGLLALRDSPLPGRDPAPGMALRRRRQAVLWFFNLRTAGPSLFAPRWGWVRWLLPAPTKRAGPADLGSAIPAGRRGLRAARAARGGGAW